MAFRDIVFIMVSDLKLKIMTCCSPLRYLVILCPQVCSRSHMMMFDRNGCCDSYCCNWQCLICYFPQVFFLLWPLCPQMSFCGVSCKCNSCLSVTANQKELAVVTTASVQFWREDRSNVLSRNFVPFLKTH